MEPWKPADRPADGDPESPPGSGPQLRRPPGPPPSAALVRLATLFYGGLAGIAVLWRALATGHSVVYASPESAARGVDWLRDPAAGLLAGLIVIVISREFTRHTRAGRRLARALARTLGPLGWGTITVLALQSGIAEEVFFRGALQVQVGWVAASVLFGLAHLVPRREWLPWSGFALVAGLLLGWLFEVTGNLVAPVIAHVLVNGVNLRKLSQDAAEELGMWGDQDGSSS